jgi:hypothetical protein
MGLKLQNPRMYRGLLWVGRAYGWVGWLGLVATACFTTGAFVHHMRVMWNVTYMTRADILLQSLLVACFFLVTGLVLSALAFAISLGIQVGLTMMENSQTRIALLRRLAQRQSEKDSLLHVDERVIGTPDLSQQGSSETPLMRRIK